MLLSDFQQTIHTWLMSLFHGVQGDSHEINV